MPHADKELYEFSDFRLDVPERLLLKKGERVGLPDKAFEILCLLVRNSGHLVGKDELLEKAWAGAFVEENNLDKNISYLRQALDERKGKAKFIETVRGRGYRFLAEVRRVEVGEGETGRQGDGERKIIPSSNSLSSALPVSSSQKAKRTGNVIALADWRREAQEESQTEAAASETIAAEEQSAAIETPEETARAAQTNAVVEGEKPIVRENVKPSHKPKRRLALIAAISIVALTGISFAFYQFLNVAPMQFEAKKTTRLTSSGRVKVAAVSPDGKFIIYSQEETDGKQSLWMRHIGSESVAPIAAPANVEYHGLDISPDGNHLYYVAGEGTLFQMAILGGTAKKIAAGLNKLPYDTNIGISPDGKQLAFVRSSEKEGSAIFIVNADGTNEHKLGAFGGLRPSLSWSPGGKIIAARAILSDWQNILAVRVEGGAATPILPRGWIYLIKMAWLPDSKGLLTVGFKDKDSLSLQIYQTGYPNGEVRQITNDTNNYFNVSATSDGRFLASVRTEQVAHIWAMPSDDVTQARQLTNGFEKYDGVSGLNWTLDNRIVFDSKPSGKESVWTVKADGGDSTQAVKNGYFSSASPDGRFIVYQKGSRESGDIGLYLTDTSNGSERQLTKGVDVWTTVSPDGKWVIYTHSGNSSERSGLWKIPIEGGEPMPIFEGSVTCPTVSPDGKTVAFVLRKAKQPNRIALISFEGGEIIKMFDAKLESYPLWDKQNLQWTPDGRGIYFVAFNNGVSNIWRQPIDGSPPVQVTHFQEGRIFNFAFSPDGKQLALSRGTFNSDVVLIENAK